MCCHHCWVSSLVLPVSVRFSLDCTRVFSSKLSCIWWSFFKSLWTFANFVKLLQSSTDFLHSWQDSSSKRSGIRKNTTQRIEKTFVEMWWSSLYHILTHFFLLCNDMNFSGYIKCKIYFLWYDSHFSFLKINFLNKEILVY